MLRELKNVRQKDDGRFRRWFEDDYFELIVWYDARRRLAGFQLCYDRYGHEHALTWHKNRGFSHDRVSSAFDEFHTLGAPVLTPDGPFPVADIAGRFSEAARGIDADIAALVLEKIDEYREALSER
jgi:hypothetical protein